MWWAAAVQRVGDERSNCERIGSQQPLAKQVDRFTDTEQGLLQMRRFADAIQTLVRVDSHQEHAPGSAVSTDTMVIVPFERERADIPDFHGQMVATVRATSGTVNRTGFFE
jgi:hypothetical protein